MTTGQTNSGANRTRDTVIPPNQVGDESVESKKKKKTKKKNNNSNNKKQLCNLLGSDQRWCHER